jgi:hypothetical protein
MKKAEFLAFKAALEENGARWANKHLQNDEDAGNMDIIRKGNYIFCGDGYVEATDWAKGKASRTYYKINGLYNAGYCDNVKKKYVAGWDFDLEEGKEIADDWGE